MSFKWNKTDLITEFSFVFTDLYTKDKEPKYLPITDGRIAGFIPFPRVLALY